jgi:valyl-tRNA synthetase
MLEKTFDPSDIEESRYQKWESSGAFRANVESNATPYTIMMPPPNVTGSLHVGHALNHILQDILCRYKRMKGFDVLWQPGTDHASIAVHMVLENQLAEEGLTRFKLGREEFMERAWKWKEFSHGNITTQLRRLGTTPDWERERFTMDDGLSKAVLKSFVQLYKEGLIYRAERLVNWDPQRQTVISDLEVNMKEVKGKLWHIQYPLEGDEATTITVATTRPETMLGDVAIAVNPKDERYRHLVGKYAVLPLVGRLIPIVADEYADPEHGSGAVKITPAHDFNDFEVGSRHNLESINIFDEKAHLNENVPEEFQGLERFEARKKILEELEAQDLLVEVEDIKHSVPYGERSGVVIEPFLTLQWFCDAPTLAKPAAQAVRNGRTKFVPKQYENMYFAWVDNQLPWCISRQLWWGHQIPAWYGPNGDVFVAESEEDALAQAEEAYGEKVKLTRDEDVLDTWFSSALWPFSTIGWPDETKELSRYFPGDTLVTGFDIITFWVSRMMMMSLHFMDEVPFKDVYIHALVRDEKGQKMSKSKGNVIDPLEMIDKFGTDSLRFTIASMAAQGRDIRLSEQRIEGYRNFTTKIWNAVRYAEMKECKVDPNFDPSAVTLPLNKWIIQSVKRASEQVEASLDQYRFNDAAMTLYQFVWNTFCDWYLEATKPLLNELDEAGQAEIKAATAWVIQQITLLLNPFIPFVTEEINEQFAGSKEMLLGQAWPDYSSITFDSEIENEIDWMIRVITDIRSIRADMNVPVKAQPPLLIKDGSEVTQKRIDTYRVIIQQMARIAEIGRTDTVPTGAIQSVLDEVTLILPIADLIDLGQERARLQKEIDRLNTEIKHFENKLSNERFVANAPEEVVEEQRMKKSEAETTKEKLSNALKQLEAA